MTDLATFLLGLALGLFLLGRYILHAREVGIDQDSCHRYLNERRPCVIPSERLQWKNITDEHGDVDVLPTGEEHARGAGCVCKPTVKVVGSNLVVVHNAFDHREIIEQAVEIINGTYQE